MYSKSSIILVLLMVAICNSYAQNYSNYDFSTLEFVAGGNSSSTNSADLANAQNELGVRYATGTKGAKKDDKKAIYWYTQAANNGSKHAQYNLAWRYLYGSGVTKNQFTALRWFEKSAQQNYPKSSLEAGKIYYNNDSVRRDYDKAITHFKNAAFGNIPEGKYYYSRCFALGRGTQVDSVKALLWIHRAIEDEYYEAYLALGLMYDEGQSVVRNYNLASYYYEQGLEHGIYTCANNIGVGYEEGTIYAKDLDQALYYYNLAANNGNTKGKSNAASLYADPNLPTYDFAKAEMLYKELIKLDDKTYMDMLVSLYENQLKKNSCIDSLTNNITYPQFQYVERLYIELIKLGQTKYNNELIELYEAVLPVFSDKNLETYNSVFTESIYKKLINHDAEKYEPKLINFYKSIDNTKAIFDIYYKRAMAKDANALNVLSWLYANGEGTSQDIDKALESINLALIINPGNLHFLDTKGNIYLINGQIKEAKKIWKSINKANPTFYSSSFDNNTMSNLNTYFTTSKR